MLRQVNTSLLHQAYVQVFDASHLKAHPQRQHMGLKESQQSTGVLQIQVRIEQH